MKISEFVRLTINEICDGIKEATKDVKEKTGQVAVAPAWSEINGIRKEYFDKVSNIDFELSIVVSEASNSSQQGDLAANISVLNVGGKKTSQDETSQERSAKINFSVPVLFAALVGNEKPKN
jgi:hypothetical protein